ncbi:hypothetical protein R69888_02196 [Paraburkholderia haematera]|uniref:Uncharacterized protein n=1 Tax=Paraburkholderia haematera TaxID=2793077 RepID=A0ABM8R5Q1_9BURK|nr:hypothetical protein R69888_02196 [Paraburkholderia haematera]
MNERSPKLTPSGSPSIDDCSKDRLASTAIYPTRSPVSAIRLRAATELHEGRCDTGFRLARMLYPYEYWSLPMQEDHFGRTVIPMVSDDDAPIPTGPPPLGLLATAGRLWRLATLGVRATGRTVSALSRKRSQD